jgi:hypothetical protein
VARITVNPVFEWDDALERYVLVSHDGQYDLPDDQIAQRFDRGAVKQAKNLGQQAGAAADTSENRATSEYGALIPGLEADATHPTGFSPREKSSILTSAGEAAGGINSGASGLARLQSMRTRNAAGFAPALDEAARSKMRTAATTSQNVNIADAQLARQKQEEARRQLAGLYGVDTSNMLKSMGLEDQDLQTQLSAGRQGWLQDTEGLLGTIANLGSAAAGVGKAFH